MDDMASAAAVPTRRVTVWDPWIRLVHWAVVGLLGLSWWTAETGRMDWHYRSGYAILTLLAFRLAWGMVGSDTARFGRFLRSPLAALRHLSQLRRREPDTEVGHNAAGGWMVLALLGVLAAQAVSGLFANSEPGFTYGDRGPLTELVSEGASAWLTALHHWNFNLILAAVALHVLAVGAYAVLKGQNLLGPMLTGIKRLPVAIPAPRIASPTLGAALLAAAALAVWGVSRMG